MPPTEPTVTFDADVLGRQPGRRGDDGARPARRARDRSTCRSASSPTCATSRRSEPRGRVTPVAVPVASNYARVAYALPRRLRRDRPDLHHGNYVLPPALPCPAVLTVSDCSWAHLGESMPVADRLAFQRFVPWSAKRAAHVADDLRARAHRAARPVRLARRGRDHGPAAGGRRALPAGAARSRPVRPARGRTSSASAPCSRARTSAACSRRGRHCAPAVTSTAPSLPSPAG